MTTFIPQIAVRLIAPSLHIYRRPLLARPFRFGSGLADVLLDATRRMPRIRHTGFCPAGALERERCANAPRVRSAYRQ
jgi:hypothetical protein